MSDDEDDICRNNHGGEENSEAANRRTNKARDQARIYAHVHGLGLRGATAAEVEDALGILHQTVSARFSEMKRDGVLVKTGERRKTRLGKSNAAVCVTRPTWDDWQWRQAHPVHYPPSRPTQQALPL